MRLAAGSMGAGRPRGGITYTNNWPAEADRQPSHRPIVVWSVISFVLLLAGIGALAWYFAVLKHGEPDHELPAQDPLLACKPTPSMRATLKYFWVVAALIVVQVGLGAVTAHYGVEGSGFYGFPLAEWLPYSVTRTWHTSSASSGSPPPGWPPACSSPRPSRATSRSSSGRASTSCSSAC
jgi:nitric oxide reductase subunit B